MCHMLSLSYSKANTKILFSPCIDIFDLYFISFAALYHLKLTKLLLEHFCISFVSVIGNVVALSSLQITQITD